MSSIPYSRYLFYPVPWYSFLIVLGVVAALVLACREEKRVGLPKDTVIDLALFIIPGGIIGARIYYVVFSWEQFRNDLLSVFRIWEGGLAIYGGIIAGLFVLIAFCRHRHLNPLVLCDMIAPGIAFAQALGRWGNWFNIEAYGYSVSDPALCFFPFAVQVPADNMTWHLATFFYESVWDFIIFIILLIIRHNRKRPAGKVFLCYLFLYAAGRLVIEELRSDSLYLSSGIRASQLFSVMICIVILIWFIVFMHRNSRIPLLTRIMAFPAAAASVSLVLYTLSVPLPFPDTDSVCGKVLYLLSCVVLLILCFLPMIPAGMYMEEKYADDKD